MNNSYYAVFDPPSSFFDPPQAVWDFSPLQDEPHSVLSLSDFFDSHPQPLHAYATPPAIINATATILIVFFILVLLMVYIRE
ncbi:hypothetical protein [Pontiella desulfatans]|uniref:hypothetical protein n=1 Tax=Pontiella desulfatans TaxID=2750659 RepID=UPI00109C1C87|nr:hypothetical protein [Pontiella desulfatans]